MIAVALWVVPLMLIAFLSIELMQQKESVRHRAIYFRGASNNE
jgi:hypothetical protein